MRAQGGLTNVKTMGTIFIHQSPLEKMPILWFDHVKTVDFGSEKKPFSITIF